eukprot:CAMPEP_0183353244 /NCGR_PEP_ID=MMETSP0164_2-20130417/33147_1 /TAXON_ID=221442 /ORGANISM="Coccolithus pelagicus ssp braarudi, Strain PLY182g" /LENGTH=111 /DNA_ID=CAMNT_0025525893 /DNA_START=208 /DNA_END=540 /DNA_ORIENTATION=+
MALPALRPHGDGVDHIACTHDHMKRQPYPRLNPNAHARRIDHFPRAARRINVLLAGFERARPMAVAAQVAKHRSDALNLVGGVRNEVAIAANKRGYLLRAFESRCKAAHFR